MSFSQKGSDLTRSESVGVRAASEARMLYAGHQVGKRKPFSRRKRVQNYNGQTAFCRQQESMNQVIEWALKYPKDSVRMLVMPSSIGCEPYTFAMMAENSDNFSGAKKLEIDSFDISHVFMKVAKEGVYPISALEDLEPDFVKHFSISKDRLHARVRPNIRSKVNFLPHSSLRKFKPEEPYDIVVAQNLLKHIYGQASDKPRDVKRAGYSHKQAEAIKNLCDLTVEGGTLFVNMVENTPFAFHYKSPPFNPFKDNGMVYLNAGLKPYRNGRVYPRKSCEVLKCIEDREYVHAFQKLTM